MHICTYKFFSYALSYFLNKPPPFSASYNEFVSKKSKTALYKKPDTLALVKCCFYLLKSDTIFFKNLWNWSEFCLSYDDRSNNDNTLLTVYVNHIVAMLTSMNASAIHELNEKIPEELLIAFHEDQETLRLFDLPYLGESDLAVSSGDAICISSNFVTNFEGVFLPIFNRENYEFFCKAEAEQQSIVRVESTSVNLRSLALGVTSGRAICLSGPVGCGKTTLVEYLARMTGRITFRKQDITDELNILLNQENNQMMVNMNVYNKRKMVDSENTTNFPTNGYLRIQLGDQTDSKMLLGQYHCTDVPGEFIWLPGVLTQVNAILSILIHV